MHYILGITIKISRHITGQSTILKQFKVRLRNFITVFFESF